MLRHVRSTDERALDAAVLVPERDLEVKHRLAVALEPEVPRLDHAGVDRTDRDLVDLAALDRVVVGDPDGRRLTSPRPPGRLEPNGLEPWVAVRRHSPLLGELALEQVNLWTLGRHRCERAAADLGTRQLHDAVLVRREHRDDADTVLHGMPE
jgi:hypothetical protein